ncbi:MAG: hypothetical protein ACHQF2_00610 [Flavobacteriales bacterium]
MKTITTLFLPVFFVLGAFTIAPEEEEKELKRPGNIGDSGIDDYVNQCFDNYEGVIATDKNLATIEKDLEKIEKDGNKIKSDADILKRLYAIQGEIRKRDDNIKGLDSRAAGVLQSAKDLKPVTKAPKATKNVNTATKALKISQEKSPAQAKKTQDLILRAEAMVEK